MKGSAHRNFGNMDSFNEEEEDRLLQLQLQADVGSEVQAEAHPAKKPKTLKRKAEAGNEVQAKDKKQKPKTSKRKAEAGNEVQAEDKKLKPKALKRKAEGPMTPESDEGEITGVPSRIKAERHVKNKVELLIQWKNYPNEEDWTWELESEFKKSAPKMVQAWKLKRSKESAEPELQDVVEKILGKRKQSGVPHYLVKWEGYEKVEDRTWEPCDRLKVDVPEIVEAYESKAKGKGKGVAKAKK